MWPCIGCESIVPHSYTSHVIEISLRAERVAYQLCQAEKVLLGTLCTVFCWRKVEKHVFEVTN